jgi:ElaB/YqjD/DUF883 family membrane-anchored ribosome-binding protein
MDAREVDMSTRRFERDEYVPPPEPGRGYSAVDTDDPDVIKSRIDRTRADMDETVNALQHKLSLDYVLDRAIGNLRDSSGRSRVLEVIRDNPIPAAMIGVGLAWLMVDHNAGPRVGRGRSIPRGHPDEVGRGDDRDWLAPGAEYYEGGRSGPGFMHRMKERASHLGEKISGAAHELGDKVRGGVEGAKDRVGGVGDRISHAGDGVRHRVSDLGHRASDVGHDLRDRAHDLGERASDLGHDLRDRASHLGHDLRDRADRARRAATHTYEENPLVMGAGALALGVILGLAFPTTRAENKLMGEASDEVARKARRMGEEALEGAQRVAERAVETVKDEVKKDNTGGNLMDTVKNVAEKTVGSVKEEAKREGQKVMGRGDTRDAGTNRGAGGGSGVSGTGLAQNSGQFAKDKSDSFSGNKPQGSGPGI